MEYKKKIPQKCHSIFQLLPRTQKIAIKNSIIHLHANILSCISLISAFDNMTLKKDISAENSKQNPKEINFLLWP